MRPTGNCSPIWQSISDGMPKVLERFYVHVPKEPHPAALIGSQRDRFVSAQSRHWSQSFCGRFDVGYVSSIRRISLIHYKFGLEPRWYIGGYAFILNGIVNLLATKHRFSGAALARKIMAVNKAVMLDMDYAVSVYQDALVDERQEKGRALAAAITSRDVASAKQTLDQQLGRLKQKIDLFPATAQAE
jgi:hypothetical protein